jgi:MFS superfamily sulfate permease-like transporter
MAGAVVVMAILTFLVGILVGALLAVAFAVRREDRHYSLTGRAPDWVTRSARRLAGVGRRDLDAEYFRSGGDLRH